MIIPDYTNTTIGTGTVTSLTLAQRADLSKKQKQQQIPQAYCA